MTRRALLIAAVASLAARKVKAAKPIGRYTKVIRLGPGVYQFSTPVFLPDHVQIVGAAA